MMSNQVYYHGPDCKCPICVNLRLQQHAVMPLGAVVCVLVVTAALLYVGYWLYHLVYGL